MFGNEDDKKTAYARYQVPFKAYMQIKRYKDFSIPLSYRPFIKAFNGIMTSTHARGKKLKLRKTFDSLHLFGGKFLEPLELLWRQRVLNDVKGQNYKPLSEENVKDPDPVTALAMLNELTAKGAPDVELQIQQFRTALHRFTYFDKVSFIEEFYFYLALGINFEHIVLDKTRKGMERARGTVLLNMIEAYSSLLIGLIAAYLYVQEYQKGLANELSSIVDPLFRTLFSGLKTLSSFNPTILLK